MTSYKFQSVGTANKGHLILMFKSDDDQFIDITLSHLEDENIITFECSDDEHIFGGSAIPATLKDSDGNINTTHLIAIALTNLMVQLFEKGYNISLNGKIVNSIGKVVTGWATTYNFHTMTDFQIKRLLT